MIGEFTTIFAVLLIASILFSKISDKFGIPSLIIFLGVGMLALIFILYAGGLDTTLQR